MTLEDQSKKRKEGKELKNVKNKKGRLAAFFSCLCLVIKNGMTIWHIHNLIYFCKIGGITGYCRINIKSDLKIYLEISGSVMLETANEMGGSDPLAGLFCHSLRLWIVG